MHMPLVLTNRRRRGGSASAPAFSPASLYSSGSQGIWLDPSDLSTMFSDRAGTTPVTTPGTVVGLRLDKSKGLALGAELVGTFAAYANASFSTVGGVTTVTCSANGSYGITLGFSGAAGKTYAMTFEVLSNSASRVLYGWTSLSSSINLNAGTTTGVKSGSVLASANGSGVIAILGATAGETFSIRNISVKELAGNHAVAPTDAARPTYGIEPKGGRRNLLLATDTLATQSLTVTAAAHTLAFTGTGTVTLTGASTAGPLVGTGAGNRVSLTFTPTAASLTLTVSGSVTLGQLELGSSVTAYQKVVTAENVTEAGVATCHYCRYDGANNSMSTSAIDFTATDKMSVFAGVRKLSDAAFGIVAELSTNASTSNGSFNLNTRNVPGYGFASNGTVFSEAVVSSGYTSPISNIITGLGDIAGDRATLRLNGTQAAQSTTDQGTGNYGNYPLFIGRRNNATLPFNGRDYGLIVVGKAASAGEISDTETWLAAKTAQVTL